MKCLRILRNTLMWSTATVTYWVIEQANARAWVRQYSSDIV